MDAADENTQLKGDFQPREIGEKSAEQDETDDGVEMNDAIEKVGAGCGTFLYSLGPFLMFALEGGEVIVLSIVGLMVKCEWNLSTFWVAVLQVNVFVGMMLASIFLSGAGDKFGRKPVGLVAAIGVTSAGLLCGLVTSFWQLAVLRGLVGVFMGIGIPPCVALTAEISTIRFRGLMVSYVSLSWGVGASLTSALAFFVVAPYGWRGLMIGTALLFSPSILFLSIFGESPRFAAKNGDWAGAEKTLQTIQKLNCAAASKKIKLKRDACSSDEDESKNVGFWGGLSYIKSIGRTKDLVVINAIAFAAILIYYIAGYSMPRFLNEGYCSEVLVAEHEKCKFDKSVLFDLGVISLFEPLGVVIAVILLEIIGRKKTFQASVLFLLVALTALYFCVNNTFSFIFFTIVKFTAAPIAYSPFILGSEYFPTEVRSFTIAVIVAAGRVGACSGIAVSQFVFNLSPRLVLALTQIAAVILSVCYCALKKETVGTTIE